MIMGRYPSVTHNFSLPSTSIEECKQGFNETYAIVDRLFFLFCFLTILLPLLCTFCAAFYAIKRKPARNRNIYDLA